MKLLTLTIRVENIEQGKIGLVDIRGNFYVNDFKKICYTSGNIVNTENDRWN